MPARSTTYALVLAASYGLLAAAYIVVSSAWAADSSASVDDLRRIETLKGVVFVAVTTLGVFLGGRLAMRRIDRANDERLRHERALVAAQGRVFAGVMAATVAHDANNVLTAVLADLDAVATEPEPQREVHVAQLRASVDRLVALNRRLLLAARGGPNDAQPADLVRVVRECVASLRAHASLIGRHLDCDGDATLPLVTQPLLVHQLVGNLLLNAGEATRPGGRVRVATLARDGLAVVEVHDDGPGIPADRVDTLFTSLVTTKERGAGLGLFSARACALALGGELEVGRSPLGGALLRLRLPLRGGAA
jgi:two-component system NtrC family sensor kinase